MSEKKYKMLQLDADVHKMLKEYCKEHGGNMKGVVQKLIKDKVNARTPYNSRILKVEPKVSP